MVEVEACFESGEVWTATRPSQPYRIVQFDELIVGRMYLYTYCFHTIATVRQRLHAAYVYILEAKGDDLVYLRTLYGTVFSQTHVEIGLRSRPEDNLWHTCQHLARLV